MKGIAILIISIFSVVIPIQSHEVIYVYNYDSFAEIFPQGDGVNDFHVYKYEDIRKIFDTEYTGKNIGGAFLVQGSSSDGSTPQYEGYLVDITATFYCGSTYSEEGFKSLLIYVYYPDGSDDFNYVCQERGWHYNYTWIPPEGAKHQGFRVGIGAYWATIDKAYGFDELRIRTRVEPPQTTTTPPQTTTTPPQTTTEPLQLLQRDNNTSSNDP